MQNTAPPSAPDADALQVDHEMHEEEASLDQAEEAADAPIQTQEASSSTAGSAPASPSENGAPRDGSHDSGSSGAVPLQDANDAEGDDDPEEMLSAPPDENDDELFAPHDSDTGQPDPALPAVAAGSPGASSSWDVRKEPEDDDEGLHTPAEPDATPEAARPASSWGVRDEAGAVHEEEPVLKADPPAAAVPPEDAVTSEDPPLPPGFPASDSGEEDSWNEGASSERDYVLTHPALSNEPPPLEKPEHEPFSTSEEFHEPDLQGKATPAPTSGGGLSDAKVMLVALVVVIVLVAVAAVLTHVVKL